MLAISWESNAENKLLDVKITIIYRANSVDQVSIIWSASLFVLNFPIAKESDEDDRSSLQILLVDKLSYCVEEDLGCLENNMFAI